MNHRGESITPVTQALYNVVRTFLSTFNFSKELNHPLLGNSVTSANDKVASTIIDALGLVVSPEVAVGLTCSPLSTLGLSHNSWYVLKYGPHTIDFNLLSYSQSQPVCCENNNFNGLIVIGCSPSKSRSYSLFV